MEMSLTEPLTKDWFKKCAERHGLELILTTDESADHHLLCIDFSGVSPALTVRSTEPDGAKFIAILYKRPEPDPAADAAATQRFAS